MRALELSKYALLCLDLVSEPRKRTYSIQFALYILFHTRARAPDYYVDWYLHLAIS